MSPGREVVVTLFKKEWKNFQVVMERGGAAPSGVTFTWWDS